MKKILSSIITLVLVLNLLSVPIFAAEATDKDLVDEFVDNVFELKNKNQFVDLLDLLHTVSDTDGVLDAYEAAFKLLAGSQQARLESFGVTVDAVGAFLQYILTEDYDKDKLEDYLGLNGGKEDKDAFKASIIAREIEFRTELENAGADVSALDTGFERMDKIFALLNTAKFMKTHGIAIPFLINLKDDDKNNVKDNLMLTLDSDKAEVLIQLANEQLVDKIENTKPVLDGIQEFVDFYNDSGSDQQAMYDYLDEYGFIRVLNKPKNTDNNGTNGNVSDITIIEELIPEELIPGNLNVAVTVNMIELLKLNKNKVQIDIPDFIGDRKASVVFDKKTAAMFAEIEDLRLSIEEYSSDEIKALVGSHLVYEFTLSSGEGESIINYHEFDGKVTVNLPYELKIGEDEDSIVVYYINENNELEMIKDCDYKDGMISFNTNHFSLFMIKSNAIEFDDTEGWYKNYVEFLSSRGIMNGKGDKKFDPNGIFTRAEAIQTLANISGVDLTSYTDNPFEDVSATDWYAKSISWAESVGLAKGNQGKFNPMDQIKRQDLAVLIQRYVELVKESELPMLVDIIEFEDDDSVSDYAKLSVGMLQGSGIIGGTPEGKFLPGKSASRSEAAKVFTLLVKILKDL